jgi:hypothetical protein
MSDASKITASHLRRRAFVPSPNGNYVAGPSPRVRGSRFAQIEAEGLEAWLASLRDKAKLLSLYFEFPETPDR